MIRRIGLGLSFLPAACGLLPSEPAGSFPSDGIGAFEDSAPVEVCLGAARIVSPALATGATALCVAKGKSPALCSQDSECRGIERCICGRCTVEPCQGVGSCQGDWVCRGKRCTTPCTENADCTEKERCVGGGCATKCTADGDCHYGERCDSLDDVCVTSLCGGGGSCGSSGVCEHVADVGDLEEPTFLGLEQRVFLSLKQGARSAIYAAHIDSPLRYSMVGTEPVLSLESGERLSAPSLLRRGNTIEMYAEAGDPPRILRAKSNDDGLTFQIDMDPLLVAEEPWENFSVGSPSIVELGGKIYLFYEGGAGAGIGLAEIVNGKAIRLSKSPAIQPSDVEDPIFWRSVSFVGDPYATLENGVLRLFFTAKGYEGFSAQTPDGPLPPEQNDSIGIATTSDLKTYALYPAGPILARVANLRAYLGERDACERTGAGGAEMLFVSSDAKGENAAGIYRARGRGARPE